MEYDIIIDSEGEGLASIYLDGVTRTISQSHPNFIRVVALLTEDGDRYDDEVEDELLPLLDTAEQVQRLDDRVLVKDEVIQFDGEPVHDNLANTIMRYLREGKETDGLVKFMENLAENPSRRARQELFTWVQSVDLTITEDGHFIGYKGVNENGTSVTAGPGIVNGEELNGHLPNDVGNVVEIDRTQVDDDFRVGCSVGLHVGDYNYAKSFGRRLLEVKVNPADVVSVPSDCSFAKIRVCRYEVVKLHDAPVDDLSWWEPESSWDEDEAYEHIEQVIPQGFLAKLKARLGRKVFED